MNPKAKNLKTREKEVGPVFCRDCRSRDSWEREPEKDIYGESGKLLWKRWICRVCGHRTIYSV